MLVSHSKSTPKFIYFLVFIAFLMSMRCWIGFEGRSTIYTFVFFALMVICGLFGYVRYEFKRRYIVFSLLAFIFILYRVSFSFNLFGLIGHLVTASNILLILCIPDSDKKELLLYIVKWFGMLMLASLMVYFATFFIEIPYFGIIQTDYGNEVVIGQDAYNYLVYIKKTYNMSNAISTVRFNGPFIEPGDIGCVASFLLMATKFEFKKYKYLWVVLIANFVCLSLAGYVLSFVGFLFCFYYDKKISLRNIILLFVVGVIVYNAGHINNSDNLLNNMILSRLESDTEKGFSGNNRSTSDMDLYFEKMSENPTTLIFGYDSETVAMIKEDSPGAGFISLILSVGFLGFLLICSPYFYFSITSKTKTYAFMFFIVFLLFMYQRSEALWIAYIVCYVYGIVVNEREKNTFVLKSEQFSLPKV